MNFKLDSLSMDLNNGFLKWAIVPALLMAVAITACDQEEEPIPAYLTIENFELKSTDLDDHGSISHKITHADVFMFDSTENKAIQLGVFELPITIPVANLGDFSLNIDPVIRANGSSLYLQPYPFYTRYSTPISLSANGDMTVRPTTIYSEETVFEVIEDYEENTVLFSVDRDDNSATAIERTAEDAFEGTYSGRVLLDTANAVVVAQTAGLYDLDFGTVGKIFLELNYKTEVPLEFGVVAVNDQGEEDINFEFVVLAKNEWNKIYFDLTDIVATSGTSRFALIFRGGIPLEDGKYTLNEAKILLDNVKLVHF